jgi:solute:Na+ symporter, SSS family
VIPAAKTLFHNELNARFLHGTDVESKPGMRISLTPLDGFILLLCLGVILATGIYFFLKQDGGVDNYFFAGRRMGWLTLGASLFSSQFLLGLVLPMTGSLLSATVTIMGSVLVTLLAMLLARQLVLHVLAVELPFGFPEALKRVFHLPQGKYLSAIPAALLLLIRLTAVIMFCNYACGSLLGWDPGTAVIGMMLFIGFYTIVGGFQAVVVTQAFQAVSILSAIIMLAMTGGGKTQVLSCDLESLSFLSLTGLFLFMAWSLAGDQYIVQHFLSARTSGVVKKGITAAALLNTICLATVVVIVVYASPGGSVPGDLELPTAWGGLMTAGILSVSMSMIAGIFSSGAAYFTIKIFQPLHPESSERKLVLVGRLATTSLVIASIVAVMVARLIGHDGFALVQTGVGMIAAPAAAVWCVSLFRHEASGWNSTWVLAAGGAIGGSRLILEALSLSGVHMNEASSWFVSVHFLSLTAFIFFLTFALLAGRSVHRRAVRYFTLAKSIK